MILRRLVKSEHGSAAVEFAMVLPVVLLLLFGVIELGSAWYARQMLAHASREGARLGSLHAEEGITPEEIDAQVKAFLNDSGFPGSGVQVQMSGAGASFTTGTEVTVQVTADWSLPVLSRLLPAGMDTITLGATTIMRHE